MDNRTVEKFSKYGALLLCVAIVYLLLKYLSNVLLPFFVAWFFAYLLFPVVKFVQYKCRVRLRALSIIITLLLFLGFITCIMLLIIPPIVKQMGSLVGYLHHFISNSTEANYIVKEISDIIQQSHNNWEQIVQSPDFLEAAKVMVPKVLGFIGHAANVIWGIIGSGITILYMFFILLDYEYLSKQFAHIVPRRMQPVWQTLLHDFEKALSGYVRGQCVVAFIMGVLFCIGFTFIDFPMAIGLGVLIGILDLVPYLHTLALIPTALLAALKAGETGENFLFVFGMAVLVFAVVQVIIDTIVTPKVMGKAMGLNPAVLLLSLSVWGSLLGFIGLILALPLTTLLIVYWHRYVTKE